MTPLRRQMLDAMYQRGFSPQTQQSYIYAARSLAAYFGRSPARLSMQDLQQYFKVLAVERKLSASTCRLHLHSIRFLFQQVLQRSDFDEVALIVPKRPQRIPPLLTRAEVARIIEACDNPKHRMLLEVCYGCGLRVSEVVALRVDDIDGERRLLRMEQGMWTCWPCCRRCIMPEPATVQHILNRFLCADGLDSGRRKVCGHLQACLNRGATVVDYLGRYTHRIAITHQRIVKVDEGGVHFTYKDYRTEQRKVMALSGEEFGGRVSLSPMPERLLACHRQNIASCPMSHAQGATMLSD